MGQKKRWTSDQTLGWFPEAAFTSISMDGRYLAYASIRTREQRLWIKKIARDSDTLVTGGKGKHSRPILNRDGSRMVYMLKSAAGEEVLQTDIAARMEHTICRDCGLLRDWSPDESRVLTARGHALLETDLRPHATRVLADGSDLEPQDAVYSPDGKWIAMVAGILGKRKLQGVVFPARPRGRQDWMPITEELYDLAFRWSPNGNVLYFLSRRDDHRCLWAQKLDPHSKRPVGQPFAVEHFHSSRERLYGGWFAAGGPWVGVKVSSAIANLYMATPRVSR